MSMPTLNLSPRLRLVIYLATGIGSALVAYLVAKGLIGDAEVTLWAAISALVNGLAALNTPTGAPQHRGEHGRADGSLVLAVMAGVVLAWIAVQLLQLLLARA